MVVTSKSLTGFPNNLEISSSTYGYPTKLVVSAPQFSLVHCFARYLAGGPSLKEYRHISRKRYYLAGSGVGIADKQANQLFEQAKQYLIAVNMFMDSKPVNKAVLCDINRRLTPNDPACGKIRTTQNWIGGDTLQNAQYVCPPPDELDELLENWLTFINGEGVDTIEGVVAAHIQLLSLHPFLDGNGRVARALLDAKVSLICGNAVPLLLYRLSQSQNFSGYRDAITAFREKPEMGLAHPFWQAAINWSNTFQSSIEMLLSQINTHFNHMMNIADLDKAALKVFDYLWRQPIICEHGLVNQLGLSSQQSRLAIKQLCDAGVIQKRLLRHPGNAVIYDCPVILELIKVIDEMLYVKD